ncbi:TPA: nuclease-related domain-containing protein, partial [Photobacterium damselae]
KISRVIDDYDISKLSIEQQVWSHIRRAERIQNQIQLDIDNHLNNRLNLKNLTPNIIIKNIGGGYYNPDSELEKIIKYLTLTLKLLSYKNKLKNDDMWIFPSEVEVSDKEILLAEPISYFAKSWMSLEDIINRTILLGGTLTKDSFLWQGEIKTVYSFKRDESGIEYYDAVACERVRKILLQNFVSIYDDKNLSSMIADDLSNLKPLSEKSFIDKNEAMACITMSEVFCCDIYTDETEYMGLKLSEWIRGYSSIIVLAHKKEMSFNKEEIINHLINYGITIEKAYRFLNIITFNFSSKDIFDTPFLCLEENKYYLFSSFITHLNVPQVIISRMSSLDVDSSKKGHNFEIATRELLQEKNIDVKGFKFKRNNNEYEYDAVFVLDDKLFVLECKNKLLSWYNPNKLYRQALFLDETIEQIKRQTNALIEYPEVVKEHFGIDINEYEIIPIIYQCLPFSYNGKYNGVYMTDRSSFSRFLKGDNINSIGFNGITAKTKYKQWECDILSSKDIINHLEKPLQLQLFNGTREKIQSHWLADKETKFIVPENIFNFKKYKKQENKIFGIAPVNKKNKKNKKNNKNKLIKDSKKKNRK